MFGIKIMRTSTLRRQMQNSYNEGVEAAKRSLKEANEENNREWIRLQKEKDFLEAMTSERVMAVLAQELKPTLEEMARSARWNLEDYVSKRVRDVESN